MEVPASSNPSRIACPSSHVTQFDVRENTSNKAIGKGVVTQEQAAADADANVVVPVAGQSTVAEFGDLPAQIAAFHTTLRARSPGHNSTLRCKDIAVLLIEKTLITECLFKTRTPDPVMFQTHGISRTPSMGIDETSRRKASTLVIVLAAESCS